LSFIFANFTLPGGGSWGVFVTENGKTYALINGEKWGPYEAVWPGAFSADGSSWGFKASDGERWFGVVNGEKVGYHDEPLGSDTLFERRPNEIVFSGDGSVWGFTLFQETEQGYQRMFVLVNGELRGPFYHVGDLAISRDGSVWGITVGSKSECGALINNNRWPSESRYMRTSSFRVSDRNGSWAFLGGKEDGRYAVVNGVEHGPFDHVHPVTFSEDGHTWGTFVSTETGKTKLLINGVEEEYLPGEPGRELIFSPSGTSWAVPVSKDKDYHWLFNGIDYGPCDVGPFENGIVFSADGGTCVIGSGYGPVVVNGDELGVFRDAALFSTEAATGFFALEEIDDGYFRLLRWSTGAGPE
jgi:hypothetical protein